MAISEEVDLPSKYTISLTTRGNSALWKFIEFRDYSWDRDVALIKQKVADVQSESYKRKEVRESMIKCHAGIVRALTIFAYQPNAYHAQ